MAEAWARRKAAAFIRKGARRQLAETVKLIDQHGGMAVLEAVKICAAHQIMMPKKLAAEFIRRVDLVFTHKTKSWNDAFGEPWPGKHLDSLQMEAKAMPVLIQTRVEVDKGMGVTAALKTVAGRLGLSYEKARNMYYSFPEETRAVPRKRQITGKTKGRV